MYFVHIHPSSLSSSPYHPFSLPFLPTSSPPPSPFFFLHQVQLVIPSYFLGIGFALECGKFTKGHILKKADSFSPSSYQLSTALQKVVGFYVHIPLSVWGYFLTCAGLVNAVNCCECACASVLSYVENSFLDVIKNLSDLQENPITLLTSRSVHVTGNDFSLHPEHLSTLTKEASCSKW